MIEDNLNQALDQLAEGNSLQSVLASFPSEAAELQPLLEIAALGLSVPKNVVPTPLRRRKFAEKQTWYEQFSGVLKIGFVPLVLALVIFGAQNVIAQVNNSLPNDHLYSVKRAGEKLQLSFTSDTNKRAAFQIDLTQKRLEELKLAVATKDPAQESAALGALKEQVQTTFPSVAPVAAANAVAKNPSLLNSLVAINKEQKEVLKNIQPQPQTQANAKSAREAVNQDSQALASIIATVNDQILVDLENKISITGTATLNSDKSKITIDSTSFLISQDTVITDLDGSHLSLADLQSNSKVNVVGTKVGVNFSAKIISLITVPVVTPEVKSVPSVKLDVPAKKIETKTPEVQTAPVNSSNTLQAGAMFDPPEKQYIQ